MRRDVFQAIADPNRRAILGLLAKQQLTLNGVAENFQISRPAISKHIKILAECGLVVVHRQGRERTCEARLDKLNEVSDWVEQYRRATTLVSRGTTISQRDRGPHQPIASRPTSRPLFGSWRNRHGTVDRLGHHC